MCGKVKSCSRLYGIQVSVDFFMDIFIPPQFMPHPTNFDAEEGLYVWNFDGNELFIDLEEDIKFRVESLVFVDSEPVTNASADEAGGNKQACFRILGDIGEQGLGLTSWWSG